MQKSSLIEIMKRIESYFIVLQCFTQILGTFISNSIPPEDELCEYLQKMQQLSLIEMRKTVESYCVVLQCFTQTSDTFISNFLVTKVELCEHLREIQRMDMAKIKKFVQFYLCSTRKCWDINCSKWKVKAEYTYTIKSSKTNRIYPIISLQYISVTNCLKKKMWIEFM